MLIPPFDQIFVKDFLAIDPTVGQYRMSGQISFIIECFELEGVSVDKSHWITGVYPEMFEILMYQAEEGLRVRRELLPCTDR